MAQTTKISRCTYHLVYTKNSSNIDASIDIAAAVERVKDNAISASVLLFNEDCVVLFLGDENCCFAAGAKRIDHDVVRKHVELFLLFALYVCFPSGTDSFRM